MTSTIVALDLETTGLNPDSDGITEIGAVRFDGDRVQDKWQTLINPGQRISPFVTRLTGITNTMVRDAPSIYDVIDDLVGFIGNAPILGHNIGFDLSFLHRYKVLKYHESLDTYEMAAVLIPNAGRYKLGSLAQSLNISFSNTHRALDDARITQKVYLKLYQKALDLPIEILAEIVRLGDNVEKWAGYGLFFDALRARSGQVVPTRKPGRGFIVQLFDAPNPKNVDPLTPKETPVPLDTEMIASILDYEGAFSEYFPNYEHRPEQIEMLCSVTDAISESQHLMIEAGTGVGKSFAYLIPAALWAIQNGQRVVISTNTINLQDQLINKDIPDLQNAIDIDLYATVLKGRNNYVCPHRLETLRQRGPDSPEEMRVFAKVLVWLYYGGNGDRVQINLNGRAEREVWARISSADDGCTIDNCLKRTGGACPFYRARQAAQSAHIIIVNHALLLADISTGNRVLPEYNYLIVDEAHHLEDAITNALSFRVTRVDFIRLLRALGSHQSGTLGHLLTILHDRITPSEYAAINRLVERTGDHAFQLESQLRGFYNTIDNFLFEQRGGKPIGKYSQRERILSATRMQPAWMDVEIAWEETYKIAKALFNKLEQIASALIDLSDSGYDDIEMLEGTYNDITNVFDRLNETIQNVESLIFDPQQGTIYWAEIYPSGRGLTLHAAPLHVGPLVQKHLWYEKMSVILTSATLTTANDFEYLNGRLFAEDAYKLALGSPFDYENSTLLYIPNNIPEPRDRNGHQHAVEGALIRLCKVTGGRTLVLFTSYAQLQRTSQAIAPAMSNAGIEIYEQGKGASPHALLENFKDSERAVLLGTRAFWEGIDIPGDDLSVLVIVKLPFAVPSDPIVAARSETFDNPFYQYTVPEAILDFRQGFGRLIRTASDRGVAVILDRRVLSKNYGQFFLESLPRCNQRVGPLQNLPDAAAEWLGL
ncbi:MAG: helicase C-terminal domain-containing protein, partial [Chloroflexota bacterium]|nr:helicase C-terminal domain-containing protein [Chloroflexota bacterium]